MIPSVNNIAAIILPRRIPILEVPELELFGEPFVPSIYMQVELFREYPCGHSWNIELLSYKSGNL